MQTSEFFKKTNESEYRVDYESIRAEMKRNGFIRTRETKKLEEFQSSGGPIVYVYKDQALDGAVQVMVHPSLAESTFSGLDGVAINERFPFRSGSNMIRFPKRQSESAANPIPYGRSMRADSLDALGRLLRTVSGVTATPTA